MRGKKVCVGVGGGWGGGERDNRKHDGHVFSLYDYNFKKLPIQISFKLLMNCRIPSSPNPPFSIVFMIVSFC